MVAVGAAAWLSAIRPRTLPAGATPIIVGGALAWRLGTFALLPALAALLSALFIQIGTNLANDYYDFRKGADTPDRAGPRRASATGDLAPLAVRNAAYASFGAAVLVGLYLVAVGGWPVLAVGVAAVLSGLWYTAGPKATGYTGLADLFCLAFFGPLAVMGTLFVQHAWHKSWALSWQTFWESGLWMPSLFWGLAIGALSVAILAVNNLRDIPTDRAAGKKTLAVRFGARFVRIEYTIAVAGAMAVAVLAALRHDALLALPVVSVVLAVPILRTVWTDFDDRRAYNPALGATARLVLVYGLLAAAAMVVGR